jgi:hypothetical protein
MTLRTFVRLMLLLFTLMSACVVLYSIYIWVSVKETLSPNASFEEIHQNFGVIPLIPKVTMTPFEIKWTYGVLWAPPISTLLVFGFYSHSREVVEPFFFWLSWLSPMSWYVIDISPSPLVTHYFGTQSCKMNNSSRAQRLGSISFKSALSDRDEKGILASATPHTSDLENCVDIVLTKPLAVYVDDPGDTSSMRK